MLKHKVFYFSLIICYNCCCTTMHTARPLLFFQRFGVLGYNIITTWLKDYILGTHNISIRVNV